MAADAYLKSAAAQLQQAATAVKQSADQVRSDMANFKKQADSDISSLQTEIKVRQVELARNKDNEQHAASLSVLIGKLRQDLDMRKQELDQQLPAYEQAAKSKESTVQGLQSQAQGLQSQAGDPNLQ